MVVDLEIEGEAYDPDDHAKDRKREPVTQAIRYRGNDHPEDKGDSIRRDGEQLGLNSRMPVALDDRWCKKY